MQLRKRQKSRRMLHVKANMLLRDRETGRGMLLQIVLFMMELRLAGMIKVQH